MKFLKKVKLSDASIMSVFYNRESLEYSFRKYDKNLSDATYENLNKGTIINSGFIQMKNSDDSPSDELVKIVKEEQNLQENLLKL